MSAQLYHRSVYGLLGRLLKHWTEGESANESDLTSRFQRLKSAPQEATKEERGLIVALQNTASQDQWTHAEQLFRDVVNHAVLICTENRAKNLNSLR